MTTWIDRLRPGPTEPRANRWLSVLGLMGFAGFQNPLGFLFFPFLLFARYFLKPLPPDPREG